MYDFETILTPLQHSTDDLTYLLKHTPLRAVIQDAFGRELRYLVDGNSKCLIEQFIKVLPRKQEVIFADVLKQHPFPSDFQMLPGELKRQCGRNELLMSL